MEEQEILEMNKEDIQRFINMQARDGKTKEETFERLVEVIGITMPEFEEKEE